ncbi:glucan biosynthesis glucosyltransferase H, partial [Pseudomonas sp. OA3]|nr:glucan biosynthesis glucosyltransferase H [Pseudomonas sp. OA3]
SSVLLLSVLLIWIKGAEAYGGRTRVLLSMLLEASCSVLLAPVRMLFHSLFVTAAFLGWSVQWNSPQRVDDSTPWSEAFRRHGTQVLIGISWTALVAWLNPDFLWWLAPIVISLVLSPVVSVLTSRTAPGLAARRCKLFLIPEEHKVPVELSNTAEYEQLNSSRALRKGFLRAVVDPLYNALVCAMARARHAKVVPAAEALRDERIDEILSAGPEGKVEATRWRLLNDPDGMARLHARIWQEPQYHAWREALRDV